MANVLIASGTGEVQKFTEEFLTGLTHEVVREHG